MRNVNPQMGVATRCVCHGSGRLLRATGHGLPAVDAASAKLSKLRVNAWLRNPGLQVLDCKKVCRHGKFCSLPTNPAARVCALTCALPLRSWCRILRMMFADQSAARLTAPPARNRALICTHHCCSFAVPDGAVVRWIDVRSRHRSHRCGDAACAQRAANVAAAARPMSVAATNLVAARRRL